MKIYVLATLAVLATAAAEGHDTRHHLRGKEVKHAVKADKGILSSLNNTWHSAVDYAKNQTEDLFGDDDDDDDEDEDEDEDDEKEERRPMKADKGILSTLNNTWHSAVDYAKNKTEDLFGDDDDEDEDEDDEEEKDEKPKLPLKAHKGILSSLNNTWHSAVDYAKNKTDDLFGDDDDDEDEDEDEDEDDEKEERRPMKATKGILSTLNNTWHSAVDYAKNKTDDLFGDDDDEERDDDDDEDEDDDAKEEKYVHWELDENDEKEDKHPVEASKGILSSLNNTWHSAVDYAKNKTDDLFGDDDDEERDDDDEDDEKDDDEKEKKNVRAVKQHAAKEPAKITITFKHHA